jgi:hypothetical protein
MSAMTSDLVELLAQARGGNRIWTAKVARVTADGAVLVAVGKGREAPARILASVHAGHLVTGTDVLLLQDEEPGAMPVIVGVVADKVSPATQAEPESWTTTIGNRNVKVVAGEDLRLECGDASIVLTRDGRIVLRGVQITSRASATNRIRGGSVEIN